MKHLISFLLRHVPRKYLQLGSHYFLKIYALVLRGNRYECPVCRHTYRKLLPYGRLNPRENALCPNCLSLERHRLIWLYLKEKTDFFTRKLDILHIAPELCFIDRFEKIHGTSYITADLESPLAKVKMDIHAIPFEENRFDAVFCNHVLEHVEDDLKAISEIFRVLKPGGWAILQVPFFPPLPEQTEEDRSVTDPREREARFGQDDHVRKYGRDYADRIRSQGFRVYEDNFVDALDPELQSRYALPQGEVIHFCQKPAIASTGDPASQEPASVAQ